MVFHYTYERRELVRLHTRLQISLHDLTSLAFVPCGEHTQFDLPNDVSLYAGKNMDKLHAPICRCNYGSMT